MYVEPVPILTPVATELPVFILVTPLMVLVDPCRVTAPVVVLNTPLELLKSKFAVDDEAYETAEPVPSTRFAEFPNVAVPLTPIEP